MFSIDLAKLPEFFHQISENVVQCPKIIDKNVFQKKTFVAQIFCPDAHNAELTNMLKFFNKFPKKDSFKAQK